jgi:pimeloyl-ACP methyl ester carboxylesterase
VIERLHQAGRRAVAAALPLTSLAGDVQAVEQAMARAGGPVVLVGHAYSGAVIGAAPSEAVKALVYVNGLAPDTGETVLDVFTRTAPHPLTPKIAPDENGLIWLPDEAFGAAFAPSATEAEQRVLAAVQRPISLACITAPVERPAWRERPSWYLLAEEDRMILAENQRFMAERMGATIAAYALDHCPMLSDPETVSTMILQACAA